MTTLELRRRMEEILKPAINVETPYAKVMLAMLIELAIEFKHDIS